MKINKDTANAVNAAKTLIKYCARYKNCENCIFHGVKNDLLFSRCAINDPFRYKEINDGGRDHE